MVESGTSSFRSHSPAQNPGGSDKLRRIGPLWYRKGASVGRRSRLSRRLGDCSKGGDGVALIDAPVQKRYEEVDFKRVIIIYITT